MSIPYEHQGITHSYKPDFIVRLKNGINVLLETKGYKRQQESLKSEAAKRWVAAVKVGIGRHGDLALQITLIGYYGLPVDFAIMRNPL